MEKMAEVLIQGPVDRKSNDPFRVVPNSSNNLFLRTIRKGKKYPKERECTELLCSIMRNSETVRNGVITNLLNLLGFHDTDIGKYKFTVDTENSVAGKHDDLRITGEWLEDASKKIILVVEIKVSSGFSYSPPISGLPTKAKKINQVLNYDFWLNGQHDVDIKGGFVLSRTNLKSKLPKGLNCKWKCLTWTDIAIYLNTISKADNLNEWETFIIRHYLGFLQTHLVEEKYMIKPLEMFDFVLFEAFANHNRDTEVAISSLVASVEDALLPLMEDEDIIHQRQLFDGHLRDVIGFNFHLDGMPTETYLFAGIVSERKAEIAFWVETNPKARHKGAFIELLNKNWQKLSHAELKWTKRGNIEAHWDIQIREPFESILNSENQAKWFHHFVDSGVKSLLAINVRGLLETAVNQTR